MAFARQAPRLHFNAVEPGFNPTIGLGGDVGAFVRFLQTFVIRLLVPLLIPFIKILGTPKRAERVIIKILIDGPGQRASTTTRAVNRCSAPRSRATLSSRTASSPRPAHCPPSVRAAPLRDGGGARFRVCAARSAGAP
jgi:hypothetical protein